MRRVSRSVTFVLVVFALVSQALVYYGEHAFLSADASESIAQSTFTGPVMVIDINGPINPATDDFLRTSTKRAVLANARLLVVRLNTPGGLITSMQSMVELLLDAPLPVAVYVSPSGASATSAGVFITLAAHIAAMAPGTRIGAAHPVSGGGQDITGDMRAKVENDAAALIKSIAEQRSRNAVWAEQAVRESVSITDREAVPEKIVDLVAADLPALLSAIEGRTVTVKGLPVTLRGLGSAPLERVEMTLKQQVINILSDPNVAILLGLGAMLGIGIELYHPGLILPGVVGVVCLVLSLTAAQVLPIQQGGVALILLSALFFVIEMFSPTFGIWGAAGIVCLVLGSLYLIDTDQVWGLESYHVDRLLVGGLAALVGGCLLAVSSLALSTRRRPVVTGTEGLVGLIGVVKSEFSPRGKVYVRGEYWWAVLPSDLSSDLSSDLRSPPLGASVRVVGVEQGMTLVVERVK